MFSRLDHDTLPVFFPKDWAEGLKQILLNIYGEKCIKDEKTFEVYGFSYPNEVLMIVSYVGLDKFSTPISLSLSADLAEKTKTDDIINEMFDSVGVFFDSYFAKSDDQDEIWDDYIYEWEEGEFGKLKFFYKVTRENIGLSMEADLLLGE
ncbi:MAG: hypothetical protein Q7U04_12020 [Bacteriovorax sp.]|nr:hypothetical protein [Bacteriovorax sp.]